MRKFTRVFVTACKKISLAKTALKNYGFRSIFLGFEIFYHSLFKDGIRFESEKNISDASGNSSGVQQIAEYINRLIPKTYHFLKMLKGKPRLKVE